MDGAVGAARQRLAQDLRRTCGPGRAHDHLAAMLFAKPQRLLEGVGVGLVHLEAGVLLAHGAPRLVDPRLPLAGWDLLDADGNLHF